MAVSKQRMFVSQQLAKSAQIDMSLTLEFQCSPVRGAVVGELVRSCENTFVCCRQLPAAASNQQSSEIKEDWKSVRVDQGSLGNMIQGIWVEPPGTYAAFVFGLSENI